MNSKHRGVWFLRAIGLALILSLIYRIPLPLVLNSFHEVRLDWFILGVAIALLGLTTRALRLWILIGERGAFAPIWRSVSLGYFGNLILPLGGGEFVKMAALNTEAGIPLIQAITGAALDRLLDVVVLAILLCVVIAGNLTSTPMLDLAWWLGVLLILVFGAIGILLFKSQQLGQWLKNKAPSQPWLTRLLEQLEHLQKLLKNLRRPSLWGRLVGCQVLILALDYLSTASVLHAFNFGRHLPLVAPFQVGLSIMLAFALPLLPGSLGTHQAACILALAPYAVPTHSALAFSIAAQSGHFLLVILVGITALTLGKQSWRRLKNPTSNLV